MRFHEICRSFHFAFYLQLKQCSSCFYFLEVVFYFHLRGCQCKNTKVTIKLDFCRKADGLLSSFTGNVCQSSGPVYHEYCDCPEPDASTWKNVMQCPTDEPQILADFKPFPSVDLQHLRQEVPRRFANRGGLVHYTIMDNQVYRRTLGKYTDFKMFSDEMLLSLTRKVRPSVWYFHVKFLPPGCVFANVFCCSAAEGEGP